MNEDIICYSRFEEVPSVVKDFVKKSGLVQHDISLLKAFDHPYKPIVYVCYKNDKVISVYSTIIYHGKYGSVAYSLPYYSYGAHIGNEKIYDYVLKHLREEGVLTLSNCYHPFFDYVKSDDTAYKMEKFYQYIDLREKSYLAQMNSKQRNNLKRNIRKSMSYNVYIEETTEVKAVQVWYEKVYVPRMKETGANIYPLYIYMELMNKSLENKVSFLIAKINNKIIGGAFYFKQPNSYDLFMRAIAPEYLRTQAGVLLDKYILDEAVKSQISFFNWQSADKEDSPIFKYKATWGSNVEKYYYETICLNSIDSLKLMRKDELFNHYPGMFIAPYELIYGE